ncbi:MAG: EAL domain-containing protein [Pseudomonadota bacterium]
MLATDDTELNGVDRQAYCRVLPKRLDALRRRSAMLERAWDVNLLALAVDDAAALARDSRRFGMPALGDQIDGVLAVVEPLLESLANPSTAEFESLFEALAAISVSGASDRAPESASPAPPGNVPVSPQGIPLAVAPPRSFIDRFAHRAVARAPAPPGAGEETAISGLDSPAEIVISTSPLPAAPGAAAPAAADSLLPRPALPIPPASARAPATDQIATSVAAGAADPPAPEAPDAGPPQRAALQGADGRRVYLLSDGNALTNELAQRLENAGCELHLVDSVDDLRDLVQSITPNLVIVDAVFIDRLEEIGQVVRLMRPRASGRLGLMALATDTDVATRLKAMRAGADSFVALPVSAADLLERIGGLLDVGEGVPFRVMIIEDDRSQALFAESILRKAGMETCAVIDPLEALDSLERFDPELILMDLYMPNCDGMELTALIRERERFISTPIVFLSGEHDAEKRFDALSAGGDDYLEKPIRPKYLISAVTNRVRRARTQKRRVASASDIDAVTGLHGRAHLLARITALLQGGGASSVGGVLFMIIDGAQAIRERIGLSAFDALLGQAGKLLVGPLTGKDQASRFGDTSFLVLAPGRSEQELVAVGDEIRARFEHHLFEVGDRTLTLAVSIGIAGFAGGWEDAGSVVNAAERACALARTAADRKVRLFERVAPPRAAPAGDSLLASIHDALRFDRFQLVFQPIAALHGSGEEQFKVLLRLRGDRGRLHTAAEVVPVAEREGLIGQVDRWVLARCLVVLQERDRIDRPVRLFVSQSAASAADARWIPDLARLLAERGIGADRLVLEFRVEDVMQHVRGVGVLFAAAREAGFRIAIAGCEAGPSMQQLLQHVTVDYIKVAARLVAGTPEARRELESVVSLAHARDIRVIAPQVEDARTAAGLWSTGVDFVQGDFVQRATQDLEFDFRASAL